LGVHSSAQIFLGGKIIMIEVGKQAPDFELTSHLAGTKFNLGQFKGQKERHAGVLPARLDTDLKQRSAWTRSVEERVQGL
jgi:hypothetical protein